MGYGCIRVGRSIRNWDFKMYLKTKRLHCSRFKKQWIQMAFKHPWMAWNFFLGSSCRWLVGARTYFAINVKIPFPVSLGCHCTDLRNCLCELNKLVHHWAIDRPLAWLCDAGCSPNVVVTLWSIALWRASLRPVLILAADIPPGSLGFVLNPWSNVTTF